jgi:L-lactate dehydrogenase complex protein LldG
MTSARDDILANLRRSLGITGTERIRVAEVDERLAEAPLGVIPARGQRDAAGRLALFKEMAEAASASIDEVENAAAVPQAIAAYLRDHNLPATVRMGSDPRLAAMPWHETSLEIAQGRSDGHDLNAVSHAFAAVAETGTLVMTSGADNPTTLNFLPDNHIVVLSAADIGGDLESAWPKLRNSLGKGVMPRALNMITGPSRSADIEQTLFLGAHGPRSLHIVLVRDETS